MEFDFYKARKNKTINELKSKLFDEMEDALFVLTISPKNECTLPFVTDSAYRLFEILPDELFTNTMFSVYDRVHKDDRNLVRKSLIDSLKKGKKWNSVFRVQLPMKGLCWFKVSSKKETNSDGNSSFIWKNF